MQLFKNVLRDESGATAIEYGLIAALIAVAAITALSTVGENLSATFTDVSDELSTGGGGGGRDNDDDDD